MLGRPLKRLSRLWTGSFAVVFAIAQLAMLTSAALVVSMAAGAAEVLTSDGSDVLPSLYVITSLVSVPLASCLSAALGRWPTDLICRVSCVAGAVLCVALYAGGALGLPSVGQATAVAAYLFEIIFDTLFWITASERLTTRELKRHTPLLAMSFGIGGVVGGLGAALLSSIVAGQELIVVVVLFLLCQSGFARIRRLAPVVSTGGDEEEEEPGLLDALRSTAKVLRAFRLSLAISAGIVLMAGLFCLQDYLALNVYAQVFPERDALATFLATMGAAQQGVEFLVLAFASRLLLERATPLIRNLLFPATTLAGILVLMVSGTLPAAVLMQLNASALSNAIFEPVKTLNYAALPPRVLASVRMLTEGVVYPIGIALAGLGLLLLQHTTGPSGLYAAALTLAALFVLAGAAVGTGFLPSLVRSLRVRNCEPEDYHRYLRGAAGQHTLRRMLQALQVAETERQPAEQQEEFSPHPLAPHLPTLPPLLVVFPAVARFGRTPRAAPLLAVAVVPPAAAQPLAMPLAAPVGALDAGSSPTTPLAGSFGPLVGQLPEPPEQLDLPVLASQLEHPSQAVRAGAITALAARGAAALPIAAAKLTSPRIEVERAAIEVLGRLASPQARRLLRRHVRPSYEQVKRDTEALRAVRRLIADGNCHPALQILETVLADANAVALRRVRWVKAAIGDRRLVNLLFTLSADLDARVRSGAIEALASLPTGGLIRPLLSLLDEPGGKADTSERDDGEPLWAALARSAGQHRWRRMLLDRLEGRQPAMPDEEEDILELALFLKSAPLFRELPLADLAELAQIAEPLTLDEGARVATEGDAIQSIIIVRSGCVHLSMHGRRIERLEPGRMIGEGALFGDMTYRHSAEASAEFAAVSLPVAVIADLVAENPELLRSLAADVVRRMASLQERLAQAAMPETPAPPARRPSGGAWSRSGDGASAIATRPNVSAQDEAGPASTSRVCT